MGLTAFLVIAASLCTAFILFHFQSVRRLFGEMVTIMMPFIIGCVIAYLLAPIYNLLLRNLDAWLRSKKVSPATAHSIAVGFSLLISIVGAITLVSGLVALVIPGFASSLTVIVNSSQLYVNRASSWAANFFKDNPQIYKVVREYISTISDQLQDWLRQNILPSLQDLSGTVGTGVSNVFESLLSGLVVVIQVAKNVVIGFIVAAYLLLGKTSMIAHTKQMVYSVFKLDTANNIIAQFRFIHQVFGGFIRGKLLDSLVMGILCFIGTSLLKIPYAMLVSVIVGVTNIIPFFGPFIGAVPCAVLVLLNNPVKCVTFIIFIIAMQQFDGNILGPKILGNTTGLSSFWVLFAIIVFGGLFGVVGMIIGVPVFAVLVSLIDRFVSANLKKKGLSAEVENYVNLMRVDEKGGVRVYTKMKDPTHKEWD